MRAAKLRVWFDEQMFKPEKDTCRGIEGTLKEKIIANSRESRTLATLCDTSLPKLFSGELSIPQTGATGYISQQAKDTYV